MGYENVGRVWTLESFTQYLTTIEKPDWCEAITLHNTADPSLADFPSGLTLNYIKNTRDYYINELGWSAGPHLFVDEDQIFGMCDLRKKGVHAKSFNRFALGIEVLGNYDSEDPQSGRGLACWQNAAVVVRALLGWLGIEANEETILFHRQEPDAHKTCPGTKVEKGWVLDLFAAATGP